MSKVLVIDDNPDLVDLVEEVLTDDGHMVAKACDPLQGVELARDLHPHLILLDLNMPEVDGWEVLRMLRADVETYQIPVAILSVRTDIKDKIKALQDGAVDYITKPVRTDQLRKRVDRILHHV